MKKMCVLTATRAEFGLLKPIIVELKKCGYFDVKIVATGMHLAPEFGMTYREIEEEGFKIDKKIDILLSGDSTAAMAKTMGIAMISFADYFDEEKPDYLFAIADRYETLAVCATAMCERVPIIHYMGGEISEGAIDDSIRHSITKMSQLHFCCTEDYRKRIIQLGEQPDKVFNVGSTGVENIKTLSLMGKEEILSYLNIPLSSRYAVMTYHPVTLEYDTAVEQIHSILKACDEFPDIEFIVTKSNADASGRIVNQIVAEKEKEASNLHLYDSLGSIRYLSALKYAEFIIGNSSSGLLEAPSFGIPTVNIGDRQRGRSRATSIIDCEPNARDIVVAINKAQSKEFRVISRNTKNPYEGIDTSKTIVNELLHSIDEGKIDLKKTFYNMVPDNMRATLPERIIFE